MTVTILGHVVAARLKRPREDDNPAVDNLEPIGHVSSQTSAPGLFPALIPL